MMAPHHAEALERAKSSCFLAGLGDAGEALCAANQAYGIAKIHDAQAKLGFPPDATFIGAPDATVTRNAARWKQGFGYGGRIQWSGEFAVLDIKSNACGMIVAELAGKPDPERIALAARRLEREGLCVDGIDVELDLGESNHFLDLCETRETYGGSSAGAYYAILHTSGHEHRKASPWGPGIYYDECDELARMATPMRSPFGTLHVLTGDAARTWYSAYSHVQRFSLRRREALARALCGELAVVCNRTHQGLAAMNDAFLGCYVFDEADLARRQRFPLTLAPDLPAYLVEPVANFDDALLEATGFGERAARLGVLARLRSANLLPHGGGYRYAGWVDVVRVHDEAPDARRFEMRRTDGSLEIIDTPRKGTHGYRGDEVRRRMLEMRLGVPVVRTEITHVLRTA